MDARGLIDDSFAHKLFLEKDALDLTDHRIMMLLSVVLEGGSEIVSIVLFHPVNLLQRIFISSQTPSALR